MNEQRHSTPAADKGRGRGSCGRAMHDDHSISERRRLVNLPPDALAGHIHTEMEKVRHRIIMACPPAIRNEIVAEIDALQAARQGAGGAS